MKASSSAVTMQWHAQCWGTIPGQQPAEGKERGQGCDHSLLSIQGSITPGPNGAARRSTQLMGIAAPQGCRTPAPSVPTLHSPFPTGVIPSAFSLSSTPDTQRPFAAVMLLVFAIRLCPKGAGDLPALLLRCGASGNSALSPQPALSIGHGEHPAHSCRQGPTAKGSSRAHTLHSYRAPVHPFRICTDQGDTIRSSGGCTRHEASIAPTHPPIEITAEHSTAQPHLAQGCNNAQGFGRILGLSVSFTNVENEEVLKNPLFILKAKIPLEFNLPVMDLKLLQTVGVTL